MVKLVGEDECALLELMIKSLLTLHVDVCLSYFLRSVFFNLVFKIELKSFVSYARLSTLA